MRIGVIGAGPSGLAVGRSVKVNLPGAEFIIFEQADCVGGTWVYNENQFTDKHGLPVHSSMYQSLRTNTPKEIMQFSGFQFEEKQDGLSYLHAEDVVQYLDQFANHFHLKRNIKFCHHVTSVRPLPNSRWRIVVKDLQKNHEKQFDFDAVFVCNGHFHCPNQIKLEGQEIFTGFQLHSHHYRHPEPYKDKSVLVIGSGASGLDICCAIASVAKCVYLSYHDSSIDQIVLPEKIIRKPDVRRLNEKSAEFIDGSTSCIDAILYCTGYNISMPFLTPECGLEITDSSVGPLFLHMVNVNHPTMFFIGLLNRSLLIPVFDMQAQFCTNLLNGSISLPTKEDMLQRWKTECVGVQMTRGTHRISEEELEKYHNDVHHFGKTKIYDPVVLKILYDNRLQRKTNFLKYRNDVYIVIDEENFLRTSTDSGGG